MTKAQIAKKAEQAQIPFCVAAQIRELLDAARKEFGADDWDSEDVESTVLDLVTGE